MATPDWVSNLTGAGAVALLTGIGAIIKGAMDAKRTQRQDTQSAEASLREELRGMLASERTQFDEEVRKLKSEMAELRAEVRTLQAENARLRPLEVEVRRLQAIINHHERERGLTLTPWNYGGNT